MSVIPVLIVGGGPVGLALAIELGLNGIACTLIERRDGTVSVPKANSLSTRVMELNRHWGVARQVEAAGWPAEHPNDYVYVTSMTGYELGRLMVPSVARRGPLAHTPEGPLGCSQLFLDPILRGRAASLPGVTLRHRTQLEDFEQDAEVVRARVTDIAEGREEVLEAQFLVGCDGADGLVPRALGVSQEGLGVVSNSINVFFRSPDFAAMHDKGWARFYRFIDGAGSWGELIAVDGRELWRLTVFDDDRAHNADTLDADRFLRRLAGRCFAYEVKSVLGWERRESVVDRYRDRRVFLAGDAAHVNSPTGALGMHTGFGDALDLGWKLAAVLHGWGGEALLDSYRLERKPIALTNVRVATDEYRVLKNLPSGPEIADDTPAGGNLRARFAEAFQRVRQGRSQGMTENLRVGYCYEDSPIVIADGTAPPPKDKAEFVPVARPGTRAPHAWVADGISTLDLFGRGFVLLRLGADPPAAEGIARAASRRGVPLRIVDLPHPAIRDLYERPLVLVRPDGHVAWRADGPPEDALALIDRLRGAG